MSLIKVRRAAQITLPAELRDALDVREGDYLEAELVSGGVLLRPVADAGRATARDRLAGMLSGPSRWIGPGEEPSEAALMDEIVADIEEDRRKRREGDHR